MPAMRSLGLDQAQLALDGKEGAAAVSASYCGRLHTRTTLCHHMDAELLFCAPATLHCNNLLARRRP